VDFQLEWPAALGELLDTGKSEASAFYFGQEQKKFSPSLAPLRRARCARNMDTNYSRRKENSSTGSDPKERTRSSFHAASTNGLTRAEVRTITRVPVCRTGKGVGRLLSRLSGCNRRVDLPDSILQRAYDWSRVSVLQGLVIFGYGIDRPITVPAGRISTSRFACFSGGCLRLVDGVGARCRERLPTSRTALDFRASTNERMASASR